MTSLKSLKLSGFRDTLRRLLRKTPPAGDGSGGSSPAGSQQLDGSFPSGPAEAANGASSSKGLVSPSLNQLSTSAAAENHDDWSQALNGDFSDIVKSHAHDDKADILRNTDTDTDAAQDTTTHNLIATPDPTMAPPRPLSEQTRPTQKAPAASSHLSQLEENKENVPPEKLVDSLAGLKIVDSPQKGDAVTKVDVAALQEAAAAEAQPAIDYSFLNDPVIAAERAQHLRFIGEALDMARLALQINETPVGCVLVHDGKIIAKGMNATNVTRNGTRHAEYMALAALFSYPNKDGPRTTRLKPKQLTDREEAERAARRQSSEEEAEPETEQSDAVPETLATDVPPHEGNEDGKKGHLYPYGQKILDIERVHRSIVSESVLYVTVEPCIMCASLLRQLKIKKVYFGAVNDKFGGTGGVFSLHANSLPVREDGQTAAAHPIAKPIQLPDGTGGSLGCSHPPGGGDGGNVELGYEIEGGWGRDDAVALLRRFYVQENGRAPVPRKKEGRAARLAAMMGQDGVEGDADDETATPSEGVDTNEAGDDVRKPSSESSYDDAQPDMDGDNLYDA
ncbi:Cytidine deaminase-like protein [Akanthomyces lecanii RCEF 1005]|uniref:Cytidine deaminase-like protein n=1 Tax=Akanthomyces lecanii RCEF 1005 TaxID=1081108 RepID=A0A168FAP6_CORDF|nr:Cytidine deaminase-like protein [Akanthomyces lecanii RCEF 1005]